jgi:hypothetical protein
LQKDLGSLGKWANENMMKINPSKCKSVCFTSYESLDKGPTKLYVRGSINSGMKQLQIFENNLTRRLKLSRSCQLHGEEGLEGTTFHNAHNQKG